MRLPLTLLLSAVLALSAARATTYYVAVDGRDAEARDGLSPATAWASLAYACERVGPAAEGQTNEIRLAPGRYIATRRAIPRSGQHIIGAGAARGEATFDASEVTELVASPNWTLTGRPRDFHRADFIIGVQTWADDLGAVQRDVAIEGIRFRSDLSNLLTGAVMLRDVHDVRLRDLHIEDFAFAGLHLGFVEDFEVADCHFENANRVEDGHFGGNVYTRWVKRGAFRRIAFRNTHDGERPWGVGYKGGGHVGVLIEDCDFTTGAGFDIEVPFENEYGLEIRGCVFNRTISIPKPVNQDDPNSRGYPYSFWIHDNTATTSYWIEGPRSHLRLTDNFVDATDHTNGRLYAQFGGDIDGPVEIARNVLVGVDRSFIWNRGDGGAGAMDVHHNTVYYKDAADRAGPMLDVRPATMHGWSIRNNVFVAHPDQPRAFGPALTCADCDGARVLSDNLIVGATDVAGATATANYFDVNPGFALAGGLPWAHYAPAGATSFVVDRGADLGGDYAGAAPDLGAVEYAGAGTSGVDATVDRPTSAALAHNPVTDYIQVVFPAPPLAAMRYSLYTISGQRVVAETLAARTQTLTIDIDHLPAGLYTLAVSLPEDRSPWVRRVLKQ